jgi:hypothetical protein
MSAFSLLLLFQIYFWGVGWGVGWGVVDRGVPKYKNVTIAFLKLCPPAPDAELPPRYFSGAKKIQKFGVEEANE